MRSYSWRGRILTPCSLLVDSEEVKQGAGPSLLTPGALQVASQCINEMEQGQQGTGTGAARCLNRSRGFVIKADDLSSMRRTHIVERENPRTLHSLLSHKRY